MTAKSRTITIGAGIGIVALAIFVNYFFSEIYSTAGNRIRRVFFANTFVKAEVVDTEKKISQGLAGRKSLADGRGMLFIMPKNGLQRFWMKGMQFPIDIIWMEQGRVVGCEKNVSQNDERIFTSPAAASVVLEVPEGFCDHWGININDEVGIR